MEFIRKNVQKSNRNGAIISSTIGNYYKGAAGGASSTIVGNYLPAIPNGDSTYTVDLSKVVFTGSVISEGEVIAYGSGTTGGTTSDGNVTIYDGLDSEATDVALSANQGRILKDMIDNVDVDLSDYY
jgi:hypothetical protein